MSVADLPGVKCSRLVEKRALHMGVSFDLSLISRHIDLYRSSHDVLNIHILSTSGRLIAIIVSVESNLLPIYVYTYIYILLVGGFNPSEKY